MGVSEYFNQVRENLGFLIIFAFVMPGTVRTVVLTTGESSLLFTSVIGAAGAFISFAGITFDFDFFRFVAFETALYWALGLIVVVLNVIILFQVWQHSQGKKNGRELLVSVLYITIMSFVLGSPMSLGDSLTIQLWRQFTELSPLNQR